MRTNYTHIEFITSQFNLRGKPLWHCLNRKSQIVLGECTYSFAWRQWVFQPCGQTEYSSDCLQDIADFLDQLNKEKNGEA